MQKKCIQCFVSINENNCVRRNEKRLRPQCADCIRVIRREYTRTSGEVKTYPCEQCKRQCIRTQKRALCSLKCRLLANIKKEKVSSFSEDMCWTWQGKSNGNGYGEMMISRRRYVVHRISYELFKGELSHSKDIIVRHKCDNRLCIYPNHLEEGRLIDNMNDMKQRGRSMKGKEQPGKEEIKKIRENFSRLIKEEKNVFST